MKICECRLGLIGFGKMLKVIYEAIDRSQLIPKSQVLFVQKDAHKMKENQKKFGISPATLETLVEKSDLLLLGVRPMDLNSLLEHLSRFDLTGKKIMTVIAGRTISSYKTYLGEKIPIIRAMPNIAGAVGAGMTVLSMGPFAGKDFQNVAKALFGTLGEVMEVDESLMDISCAIAGSGPGFVFYLIESMAREGEKWGLSYEAALKMAAQTFFGASRLILEGKMPAHLIEEIATPGGTTEAGFHVMQTTGIQERFQKTVAAAALKSKSLS